MITYHGVCLHCAQSKGAVLAAKVSGFRLGGFLLVGAILLTVMGAATYNAYERRESDLALATSPFKDQVDLIAQRESNVVQQAKDNVEILVTDRHVRDFGSQDVCRRTLGRYLERNR